MTFPPSRVPDPMAAPPLRWGILAPGRIAGTFVDALHKHTRQRVVAAGSRSAERAAAFGRRFGIEKTYGSYAELLTDPQVHAVYVASPTGQHHEHTLAAVTAGKHVLVEKSFALDGGQAREMADAARAAHVVLVEAMWSRFLPHWDVLDQLVRDGTLGPVETVLADHGQLLTPDAAPRLHRPELGGGALLDLGVYCVALADLVLGGPDQVTAVGEYAAGGVDAQVSAVLRTGTAHAVLTTTLTARTPTTASVSGSRGRVELAADFYVPTRLSLVTAAGRSERPLDPITGHEGLCHPAAHLAQLVADGHTESPTLPLATSVRMMDTMDEIRRQLG